MPLYFFHVYDRAAVRDDIGQTHPDLAAARRAAIRFAGVLLQDPLVEFWTDECWWIEITDADGSPQLTLLFDTVAPRPASADLTDALARVDSG